MNTRHAMQRGPLALVVVSLVMAACGGTSPGVSATPLDAGPSSTAATSAEPGGESSGAAADGECVIGGVVTEVNGKTARVFCGPATATVTFGGADLEFKDGACEFLGTTLTVNLGTAMPGETSGPDYFGLTAFDVDKLPLAELPAITWTKDGTGNAISGSPKPTLTISDDQKTVEFSGNVLGGGEASGVIHC